MASYKVKFVREIVAVVEIEAESREEAERLFDNGTYDEKAVTQSDCLGEYVRSVVEMKNGIGE